MKQFFFFIAILCSLHLLGQSNTALFNEANELYNKGKYAEAIDKYRTFLGAVL